MRLTPIGLSFFLAVLFFVVFLLAGCSQPFGQPVPERGDVHHVKNNSGGHIFSFVEQVDSLKERGKPVVVEGRCFSACTIYLGVGPDLLYVKPDAYFTLHAPSFWGLYASDIFEAERQAWAARLPGEMREVMLGYDLTSFGDVYSTKTYTAEWIVNNGYGRWWPE